MSQLIVSEQGTFHSIPTGREIGRAASVLIIPAPGFPIPTIQHVGTHGKLNPPLGPPLTLQLVDWKTPAPVFSPSPVQGPSADVNEMLVISALVHQLGGAVVIQHHELERAKARIIRSSHSAPSGMMTLTTEDK